jgi:hypothetical protein
MRATLDRAWTSLPAGQQAVTSRSLLAERILRAAARGSVTRTGFVLTRSNPLISKSRVDVQPAC